MNDNWYYNSFVNEVKSIGRSGSGSVSVSVSKAATVKLTSDNWIEEGHYTYRLLIFLQ